MLVTRQNFTEVLEKLSVPGIYSFDTETTGLRPYHGDRLFCFVIASAEDVYLFNFQIYPSFVKDGVCDGSAWLGEEHMRQMNEKVFSSTQHTWAMHNAKFDMRICAQDNIDFAGRIWCTMAQMRLVRNDLMSYSLDSCAQYAGLEIQKSSAVKDWCDANHGYEYVEDENTGKKKKHYRYHMVPLEIMQPYAETDAVMTRQLALWQMAQIDASDAIRARGLAPLAQVSQNECRLTKAIFRMEHTGVLVDREFCQRAVDSQKPRADALIEKISELCGAPFKDSGKFLGEAFKARGITLPMTTAKVNGVVVQGDNTSVSEETLSLVEDELARLVLALRVLNKSVKTYFRNFLLMADRHDRIHTDFVQSGAATGRISCREPNLQNLTRNDEDEPDKPAEFNVRDAFIPTPGFCFFAPDYSAVEYRLMLDYAEEMEVIKLVLSGLDVHSASASMAGVARSEAKKLNFAWLYGSGDENLAKELKVTVERAKKFRATFSHSLPRVGAFIQAVKAKAARAGVITNWYGRRCYFANPKFAYKAPNHLIQGGSADVTKLAMVGVDSLLHGRRSRMLLSIHDEIVVELHESELELAPEICRVMESVYPHKHLPLTVEPSFSWHSLGQKHKGFPTPRAS